MVKSKHNPADYRQALEKKLNTARKAGFNYNALFEQSDNLVDYAQNVQTEQLLDLFDNKGYNYVGALNPLHDCMVIACDTVSFKLLNFPTMWVFEPYYDSYNYYFLYDEKTYNYLKKNLTSSAISVYRNYSLLFNKYKMFKLCPKWSEYRLANLPQLTDKQLEQILELDKKITENENLYFNINKPNGAYRLPTAIAGMLGKNILSMNAHVVLEHLLAAMSTSTAILDNSDVEQAYITDYKRFCKDLSFKGRKEKKETIINKSLDELINTGFLDNYSIENNNLIFSSAIITKHIRQQIKRGVGYYSNIPSTKQAPFIATFINYLSWIINSPAHYEKLTISLETLFCKHLGLERLLKEHRLSEIAKILNLLRHVGVDYDLLELPQNAQEITSNDVKYLLKNKTKLHEFITLKSPDSEGKEDK